jgi:hypothetical protein
MSSQAFICRHGVSCRQHVSDMSLVMSPTWRHCMSARVSKWPTLFDDNMSPTFTNFCNKVIVVLAQTSCSIFVLKSKARNSVHRIELSGIWSVEWVTSLWPVATVEGAQTLYIYIKKTCYEYELDGGSQSQVLTEDPSANPCTTSHFSMPLGREIQGISRPLGRAHSTYISIKINNSTEESVCLDT